MCSKLIVLLCAAVFMIFPNGHASVREPVQQGCSIADLISGDYDVYHVGSYEGTSELGAAIELDKSGHHVKKVDVVVNQPGKAIVLVMTAYDPVVWNVSWTKGTQIKGVVLSGYHGQAVVGISKSIPLHLKTYLGTKEILYGKDQKHCPALYNYKEDNTYAMAAGTLKRITGRKVTMFIEAPKQGIAFVGKPIPVTRSMLEFSKDYSLNDFTVKRKPGEVPAGLRGLEELAKRGDIRHATPKDIRNFEASGVRGIVRGLPTYVVLKKTTMPDGLGGYTANILVPAGVPVPRDPDGQTFFFRYGKRECRDGMCR